MNPSLRREPRVRSHVLARAVVSVTALTVLASCATTGGGGSAGAAATVFIGRIVTLDDRGTVAEAVSVDGRGRILKVGSEQEVTAGLGSGVEWVRLESKQVLLPGFIDPHMHLLPTLAQNLLGTHNLAPCLPPPYRLDPAMDCATNADLLSALKSMAVKDVGAGGSKEFVLGMNLDPSRQQFVRGKCGVSGEVPFMKQPKLYLDACVTKDRPVLILDQSGHLAYVNDKAFEAVCGKAAKCKPPESVTANGGRWVVDDNGNYTGLLQESAAFAPFMAALKTGLPLELVQSNPRQLLKDYERDIARTIQDLRKAGLTTIADGGLTSASQVDAVRFLAELPDFPLRVTALVTHDAATQGKLQATGPACDPGTDSRCRLPKWLGAGGIKLWVDGSTQGCTALLGPPYEYLADGGHCSDAKEGAADFANVQAIVDALSPLWATSSWRFQLHANGNLANQWAIDAFSKLQQQQVSPHRMLLIHNTVGQEQLSRNIGDLRKGTYKTADGKAVPGLDIRVTHLIGHVAYWGAAFKEMLGEEGARNLDPMAFDRRYGVPFSLHSDSMVTPARPLWFVEQAVTRRTWAYPDFKESFVLGLEHAVTVEEALRAVTLEPARQHEIDQWVGSIEPGKVADFVVLGENPLEHDTARGGDPTRISRIQVIQTYLNGKATVGGN